MEIESSFYPDYGELALALGLIALGVTMLVILIRFIKACREFDELCRLSRSGLYVELSRCFNAMAVCAARGNRDGVRHASRRAWMIGKVLGKCRYTDLDKEMTDERFGQYLPRDEAAYAWTPPVQESA